MQLEQFPPPPRFEPRTYRFQESATSRSSPTCPSCSQQSQTWETPDSQGGPVRRELINEIRPKNKPLADKNVRTRRDEVVGHTQHTDVTKHLGQTPNICTDWKQKLFLLQG
ncbi:hypothetical protein M8J76_013127 [Diaphorina citri]|nr:hypothetical protein M8J76_013127 [Diaphorina citri]